MATPRASKLQSVQIGPEVTPGSTVAAGKVLESINVNLSAKFSTKEFRPQGRRFNTQVLIETEHAESKYDGLADFETLQYPLSVFGQPATTTVFTSATQRVWTPTMTGNVAPQSFTIQVGDASTAEQISYAVFNSLSLKATPKDVSISGDILSQSIMMGQTLTATPTVIAAKPITANMVSVYLDSTSAGIGTTKLTSFYEYDLNYSGPYGPVFTLDSANSSFAKLVDMPPKAEVKIKIEANTIASNLKTALESGTLQYLRFQATGGTVGTAGNYKLTLDCACRVSNIGAFSDSDGVYAIEISLSVAEDAAWTANGQALVATLVNDQASL